MIRGYRKLLEVFTFNIQYQFHSTYQLLASIKYYKKSNQYKVHLGFIRKWPHGKNHYLLINCVPPQEMIDWLIKKHPDNNWRAIGSYFSKLGKTQFPVLLLTAHHTFRCNFDVNYFDFLLLQNLFFWMAALK